MRREFSMLTDIKIMLKRLGIVLALFSLTRIIFYLFNMNGFAQAGIMEFFVGFWFDCITIALYFLPWAALTFIPVPDKLLSSKRIFLGIYYYGVLALCLAMNLMDVEYFKYTSKRSTFDLFAILGAGSDLAQLATTFIKDFWILLVFLILIIALAIYLERKIKTRKVDANWKALSFHFLIIIPLFVLIGRGGFQLKPVGIIDASQYTNPQNSALVLNTPFTMLKSYGKKRLALKNYFSEQEEKKLFNPIKKSNPQNILPNNTNVVVIILESFGNEFVGAFNGGETYTPFFDSLLKQSLTFEYGIANGKKSIEAVPAIIASIPSLMDNPYISSPYGNNTITSLASIFKDNGYSTAFYHGATNGSMRFDAFAAQAGYEKYVGRYEYNNDAHFDKTWGILDEFFNPWTAKQISLQKTPFFATLFTLSSHHPFYIPAHMRNKVKKGPYPICASINYGDYALKKFFDEAKKQPWYNNTLFVLVADHTSASGNPLYNERKMMYQIPIAFFHPKGLIPAERKQQIFQQLDIMPTILDLTNIKTTYYSFGKSLFTSGKREAITYLEGSYFYFSGNHMYTFSNDKARNLVDFTTRGDKKSPDSLSYYKKERNLVENRVKAIIQRYNRDMVHNETVVK